MLTQQDIEQELTDEAFGRYLRWHQSKGCATNRRTTVAEFLRNALLILPYEVIVWANTVEVYETERDSYAETPIEADITLRMQRFTLLINRRHPRGGRIGYREALKVWEETA